MSYHTEWRKNKIRERKEMYIKKLGGSCIYCGSVKDLEFDHINPNTKVIAISQIWCRKLSVLEKEVSKCQLLCKPCHGIKSGGERKKFYASLPTIHGVISTYSNKKCKCEDCRLAWRTYWKTHMKNYRVKLI